MGSNSHFSPLARELPQRELSFASTAPIAERQLFACSAGCCLGTSSEVPTVAGSTKQPIGGRVHAPCPLGEPD